MIEEIKNEIIDLTPLLGNKEGVCILRKEVFEILDKYNNQPDYKSAFGFIPRGFQRGIKHKERSINIRRNSKKIS